MIIEEVKDFFKVNENEYLDFFNGEGNKYFQIY